MARAPLSQLADYQLVDKDQDIRGWPVRDESGKQLGTIRYLIMDTEREEVDTIALEDGQEFPVEDIDIRGDHVLVHSQRAEVAPGDPFRMRCVRRRVA
jgi:hypothetical protein